MQHLNKYVTVPVKFQNPAERSASATQESIQVIEASLRNVEQGIGYAKAVNESL